MIRSNNFRIVGRATSPVVSLDELKTHLNLFNDTSFDTYLTTLANTGGDLANDFVGEFLSPATIQAFYGCQGYKFELPHRYISIVISVQYFDEDGVEFILEDTDYIFDTTGDFPVVSINDDFWSGKTLSKRHANPVSITYEASVDSESFRETFKHAVLMYCASLFANRENYLTGGPVAAKLPVTSQTLLAPIRRAYNGGR